MRESEKRIACRAVAALELAPHERTQMQSLPSNRFFYDPKKHVIYRVPTEPSVSEKENRNKPAGWTLQAQIEVLRKDNFSDPDTNRWRHKTTEFAQEEYFIPQDTLETAKGYFEQFKYLPLGNEIDATTYAGLKKEYEETIKKTSADLKELYDKLLKIGGSKVNFDEPRLTTEIISRGVLQKYPVSYVTGTPSKCHLNAAERWFANEKSVITTGYVLIGREWILHSWNIEDQKIVDNHAPEANTKAHFGFELTPRESLNFLLIQGGQDYLSKALAENHHIPPHVLALLRPSP